MISVMHGVTDHVRDNALEVHTGRLDVVLDSVRLDQLVAGCALAWPLLLPWGV